MKKKYGLFFGFIGIVILIIGCSFFYVTKNVEEESYSFEKDGYALYVNNEKDYKTQSWSFSKGEIYNFKKSNNKIVFDSNEEGNVSIDDSTIIHYSDDSLLTLKNVVGLDLSTINNDIIFYYNIYKNTNITRENGGYQIISFVGEKIKFSNILIRINENKYLFMSSNIRVTIGKEETIDFGKYVYIEYVDGKIVHVYNNTKSNQSIANEMSLVSGDITINMSDKSISKEGKKYITLSNLVIDSNSNIDIIPYETTKLPSVNKPNVDTNISTGEGADIENNGSISKPDNNVNEEVIEEEKTIKQPVYKVVNMAITPIKIDAEIEIIDEDSIITSATEVTIVNNSTLEVAYESSVPAGDTSAFISTANLVPDTEYTIYAKASYNIDGVEYNRSFVNKIFRTEAIGVSFKKSYATSNSIVVAINKEKYSDVTSLVISILSKDGSKIDYKAVDFTNGLNEEVEFFDLSNNTEYQIVMSDIQCDGVSVEEGYSETKKVTTLKESPFIDGLTYQINKKTSTFELSISKVVDNDYGILNYRYEIFRVDQDMNTESPLLTFENKDLKTVSVNVDENNLNRGAAYTYRVVIVFNDNEKIIEYTKELGKTMQLDGVEYPTLRFEESYVTWEQINGTIIIDDKNDTIVGDDYRVVYKNAVEEYETYTIISSTSEETIPIAVNNLRANESYSFQVYADINLKDGNKTIDEAYIGTVIVHTKLPQHLQAQYSTNTSYSSAFSVNMRLGSLANQDATLEASTISGMTITLYQGTEATGEVEIFKKVVDGDDSDYISTIKKEFFDTQKTINPAFFDALNGDFNQRTYTLKISDVYDYTRFKNPITIENDSFVFNINSYVPDVPTDSDEAIRVTKILNKNAEVFGLTSDPTLQGNTVVGYSLVTNYPNDALNALNLIYHVWIYNPSTNKYEILPQFDKIIPYDSEGNVSNAVYEIGKGTGNNVFDTDMLRRGNKYYFSYEVEIDLDGEGGEEPVKYPGIYGDDIILRSAELSPAKETPLYEMYPSSSTSTSATWKYKIKDIDNAFDSAHLYGFVGNNTGSASKPAIILNSDSYSSATFTNLKAGDFYSIKSLIRTIKSDTPKYSILSSQHLFSVLNTLNLQFEAEVDSNTLNVRILDAEANQNLIDRITSVDITITPPSGSNLETIVISNVMLSNGVAKINLSDYPTYMNMSLTIGMKAYYDSGNSGFDVQTQYKAFQVMALDGIGKYFKIINNELEQDDSVIDSEFTTVFDPVQKLIKITDKSYSTQEVNVIIDERGVTYSGNQVTFKELKEFNLTSSNNVIQFNMLVPSISLLNKDTNENNIIPLLTSVMFKANVKLIPGVKIENNLIYVELYETDQDGLNKFRVDLIPKTPENLASFSIDNLSPEKNYLVKFYANIETSTNVYEKYYLYDEDTKNVGEEYVFHTISNVGVDNINTRFVIDSYDSKKIQVDYTLENISGYKHIRYKLYEYVDDNFQLVDIDIPNSGMFNYDMSINIDAKPGNQYGFAYGKTYKIEIIPIGTYMLDETEVEIDLGSKSHVFTLVDYVEPQISITGSKTDTSIYFRVNVKDASKVISDSKYSVKLKRVSDNEVIYEKSLIDIKNTTDKYTFDSTEYGLEDGETYMLVVSYYVDYNNSAENLVYKEKTDTEKFGSGVSLGDVTAAPGTSSNTIKIIFADSYMLSDIKKLSYTISSTTIDYFSAGENSFVLSYNADSGIYTHNITVDNTTNFSVGNVYTITMNFYDSNNKLIDSEEVSYYYSSTEG